MEELTLLLGIRTATLEFDPNGSTVHQDITLDHTGSLPCSQYIQKRSLSCTRSTHESGECTRLDVSVNIGEELFLATLDRDEIVELFPSERNRFHLQAREILFEFSTSESISSLGQSVVQFLELLGGFVVDDNGEVVALP